MSSAPTSLQASSVWRIAVIDDHAIICAVFRSLAEDHPDMTFAWSAPDLATGFANLQKDPPDFLIVDVNLPDGNGYDFTRRALRLYPDLPVLIVSSHEEVKYARHALEVGARAFMNKNTSPGELLDAIHAVKAGNRYFKPGLDLEDDGFQNPQ